LASAKGKYCIMITPAMPRAGSIQKKVLLMPPQLRLPGERLPGT
jgi:hypothetical protein